MAGFILYFPGLASQEQKITGPWIERAGLQELFLDSQPDWFSLAGPDGKQAAACVWFDPRKPETIPGMVYNPEQQDWFLLPGQRPSPVWLGIEKARPPRPEDLLRKETLDSKLVKMADGQLWGLPTAHLLPRVLGMDGRRIHPRYADYLAHAESALRWLSRPDGSYGWMVSAEDEREAFDLVCRALSHNYRLCPAVVDCLGLVSDYCLFAALAVIVEGDALMRTLLGLQKKTEEGSTPGSEGIAPGGPEFCPSTPSPVTT